ncbi:hypothetical protein VIGAN_04048000, partial [Vigna angularis var. angularis]
MLEEIFSNLQKKHVPNIGQINLYLFPLPWEHPSPSSSSTSTGVPIFFLHFHSTHHFLPSSVSPPFIFFLKKMFQISHCEMYFLLCISE